MVACLEHTVREDVIKRVVKTCVLSFTPGPINKLRSLPRKSKMMRMPLLGLKVTTDATGRVDTLIQL